MSKKKDKYRYERGDFGRFLPQEEVDRMLDEFLARTKPEDIFPEAYKRFVEHIEMLEREESNHPNPKPDQHQTQP